MKNTIKILLTAAVLMVVAGCRVDNSEERYVSVVDEGYYVYRVTVANVLSPVLHTLDMALKVDMYVKADQYGRYDLEDRYFPDCKVRLFEDVCILTDDYGKVVFDGNSILDEGAVWKCTFAGVTASVTCTAPGEWDVDVDLVSTALSEPYSIDSMDMHVSLSDTADSEYIYKAAVEGAYTELTSRPEGSTVVKVAFSTVRPTGAVLREGSSVFHFFDGAFGLHMDIMSADTERSEDIDVILSPSMSGTEITVGYMGETESWRD